MTTDSEGYDGFAIGYASKMCSDLLLYGTSTIELVLMPELEPLPGVKRRRWVPLDERRFGVAPSLMREIEERIPEAKRR